VGTVPDKEEEEEAAKQTGVPILISRIWVVHR